MAEGFNAVERAWRILEHLRKHTDKEHRVSQKELKAALEPYFKKNNDTIKSDVFKIAQAMNSNKDEQLLPSKDWKIIYEAFCGRYDESRQITEEPEDEEPESEDPKIQKELEKELKREARRERALPVYELYYRHTFSYDEINALISALQFSRTLSTREIHGLIEKVENTLTTVHYKSRKSSPELGRQILVPTPQHGF